MQLTLFTRLVKDIFLVQYIPICISVNCGSFQYSNHPLLTYQADTGVVVVTTHMLATALVNMLQALGRHLTVFSLQSLN